MDDNRAKYLDNLLEFVDSSNDTLKKFKEMMGWSSTSVSSAAQTSFLSNCHGEGIQKKKGNAEKNEYSEEPVLPSAPLPQAMQKFTVTIDEGKQQEILAPYSRGCRADLRRNPSTAGELTAHFSREERLALYEYTVHSAQAPAAPPEIQLYVDPSDKQPRELSQQELSKALRDSKRRRQAYRTKVSTKNKSQTQVTREIIENMMEVLGVGARHSTLVTTPRDHDGSQPHSSQQVSNNHPLSTAHLQRCNNSNEEATRKENPKTLTLHSPALDNYKGDRKHKHSAVSGTDRETECKSPRDYHLSYRGSHKQERYREKNKHKKEKYREKRDECGYKRKKRESNGHDSYSIGSRGDRISSHGGSNGHREGKRSRRKDNSVVREDGEVTSDSDGCK